MTSRAIISSARLAGGALLGTQSDARLVDLVRAGNDAAFEAIVARYRRPLLRYCSAMMCQTRTDDVVQQSFVCAYDALRTSDRDMQLRPWLFRIAHNAVLNALRDRGLGHAELSESIDGVERPDQAFERRQGLRDVLAAVAALPERQRDAIVLRELEGRSHEEIAGQLGVSGGAVRQLLHRGRMTLRAGASAIVPAGLLVRLPGAGGTMTERVAELCGAGVGGAVLVKLGAATLVTGALVGGTPVGGDHHRSGPVAQSAAAASAANDRISEPVHMPGLAAGGYVASARERVPGADDRSRRHPRRDAAAVSESGRAHRGSGVERPDDSGEASESERDGRVEDAASSHIDDDDDGNLKSTADNDPAALDSLTSDTPGNEPSRSEPSAKDAPGDGTSGETSTDTTQSPESRPDDAAVVVGGASIEPAD